MKLGIKLPNVFFNKADLQLNARMVSINNVPIKKAIVIATITVITIIQQMQ